MGWIPCWANNMMTFQSASTAFLFLHFLQTVTVLSQNFEGRLLTPSLHWGGGGLAIYWRRLLQVLYFHPCIFCLRSSPLGPESLSHPRSLGLSRSSPVPNPTAVYFHSFSWPLFLSLYLILIPFSLPFPTSTQIFPSLCLP